MCKILLSPQGRKRLFINNLPHKFNLLRLLIESFFGVELWNPSVLLLCCGKYVDVQLSIARKASSI